MVNKKTEATDYYILRKEGWDIIANSSIAYDKALITLSTASLGFVLAMSRPQYILCKPLFIFVLVMFSSSIFCILLSFWFYQITGKSYIEFAGKCYSEGKEEYREKKPWSYIAGLITKIIAGAFFFLGWMLLLFYFCMTMG